MKKHRTNSDSITVTFDVLPVENGQDALVIMCGDESIRHVIAPDPEDPWPFLVEDIPDDKPMYLIDFLPDPDEIENRYDENLIESLDERAIMFMFSLWQQFRTPITARLTWHPDRWHMDIVSDENPGLLTKN